MTLDFVLERKNSTMVGNLLTAAEMIIAKAWKKNECAINRGLAPEILVCSAYIKNYCYYTQSFWKRKTIQIFLGGEMAMIGGVLGSEAQD